MKPRALLAGFIVIVLIVLGLVGLFGSVSDLSSANNNKNNPFEFKTSTVSSRRFLPSSTNNYNGSLDLLPPLPTLRHRDQLGMFMNMDTNVEYRIGAELGVQRGIFSKRMMEVWPKSTEYWLVDLWSQQANYADAANFDNGTQESIYETAVNNTKQWEHKIKFCRDFTTVCAPKFQDGYFDFIYVDARHDFKGVLVDLDKWWSKLKVGGIFAGHDYIERQDMRRRTRQDWTRNFDGTVDRTQTIVRGAVEIFFTNSIWGVAEKELVELRKLINTPLQDRMRSIKLTYRDAPASWYCRK